MFLGQIIRKHFLAPPQLPVKVWLQKSQYASLFWNSEGLFTKTKDQNSLYPGIIWNVEVMFEIFVLIFFSFTFFGRKGLSLLKSCPQHQNGSIKKPNLTSNALLDHFPALIKPLHNCDTWFYCVCSYSISLEIHAKLQEE